MSAAPFDARAAAAELMLRFPPPPPTPALVQVLRGLLVGHLEEKERAARRDPDVAA
jgi:hypothetical protein